MDNGIEDDPAETSVPEDKIQDVRRRTFIKRLAKVGALTPVAVLLHDASANAVPGSDYAVGD